METNLPNTEAAAAKPELDELEAPEKELSADESQNVEGGGVKFVGGTSLDGSTSFRTSVQYPYD